MPIAAAHDGALPTDAEVLAAARMLGGLARDDATLWRELSDPQVDAQRVARVLHADPGIAARVLKVANSSFYGRGRQVASIDRAVVVLGFDAVRGIAAAAGLDRVVPRGVAGAAFAAHCTTVACLSRAVAREVGELAAADAFLAGLLHDFGLLVAWRLASTGQPRAMGDHRLHSHWGALVLEAWRLPEAIVTAVRRHHDPCGGGRLAACVRIAHEAATVNGRALPEEPAREAAQLAGDLAACGIAPGRWPEWLAVDGAAAVAEGRVLAA